MSSSGLSATMLTHWTTIAAGLAVGTFISSAIYNFFYSPLARFPGPLLAKISSLPDFYWSLTGDRHLWIARNHDIHGDVFRYRPDGLLFRTPEAYQDILNVKANVKRSEFYDMMTRNKLDTSIITGTDPALHARKKRVLNTVFSEKSVRSMEPILVEHVARWCELLIDGEGEDWSAPRKMSDVCDHLVLDVLCDLCFGRIVNTKESGENQYRKLPHIIAGFLRILYPLGHSPWIKVFAWLKPRGLDWAFGALTPPSVKFLYEFVRQALAHRLNTNTGRVSRHVDGAESTDRFDMLHHLINAKDPETGGQGYTKEELEAEALTLTIAGSDTTSVIMAGFFFYIVRSPRAYRRLVDEVRSIFKSADEIQGGRKLTTCIYLRACVDEAMRITPAGPAELPRLVLPGGLMVDGEYIPEGTTVGVSHWSFYRNEKYFPDAGIYWPERWIVDEQTGVSAEDVAKARSSCSPFAAGGTRCAGKNFALLELYITIARTFWLYDVRLLPGDETGGGHESKGWGRKDPNTFQVTDSYISIRDGPMVQFRRRM
ncbi:cytochrome P450 [Aspergillus undulatus]|uniref:cytochrome P450 n=1 Tax=Aspergillus undulatus TaxID=1810928 RepID=UPI003CCDE251